MQREHAFVCVCACVCVCVRQWCIRHFTSCWHFLLSKLPFQLIFSECSTEIVRFLEDSQNICSLCTPVGRQLRGRSPAIVIHCVLHCETMSIQYFVTFSVWSTQLQKLCPCFIRETNDVQYVDANCMPCLAQFCLKWKFGMDRWGSSLVDDWVLKWNSGQKATEALFVIEHEPNLRVKA